MRATYARQAADTVLLLRESLGMDGLGRLSDWKPFTVGQACAGDYPDTTAAAIGG